MISSASIQGKPHSFDDAVLRLSKVTRGTFGALPSSCYGNDSTARAVNAARAPLFARASDTALGAQWASGQLFADTCYAANNLTGSLVGTAFIARDVMQIVDALGEDGLLRYWGELAKALHTMGNDLTQSQGFRTVLYSAQRLLLCSRRRWTR
jgi:hypothetical protein